MTVSNPPWQDCADLQLRACFERAGALRLVCVCVCVCVLGEGAEARSLGGAAGRSHGGGGYPSPEPLGPIESVRCPHSDPPAPHNGVVILLDLPPDRCGCTGRQWWEPRQIGQNRQWVGMPASPAPVGRSWKTGGILHSSKPSKPRERFCFSPACVCFCSPF